jgi:hypothetical protein
MLEIFKKMIVAEKEKKGRSVVLLIFFLLRMKLIFQQTFREQVLVWSCIRGVCAILLTLLTEMLNFKSL